MDPQNLGQSPATTQPPIQPQQPVGPAVDMMFQPSTPQGPPTGMDIQPPVMPGVQPPQVQPSTPTPAPSPQGSKKKLLLIVAGVVVILVVVSLVVVLTSSKKSKAPQAQQESTQPEGPQPAQAIDVEQTSNSITQDITGHDNNKDFPADQLGDKHLGL